MNLNYGGLILIGLGALALIIGYRGTQAATFHSATGK
jgi:hypothetical protein